MSKKKINETLIVIKRDIELLIPRQYNNYSLSDIWAIKGAFNDLATKGHFTTIYSAVFKFFKKEKYGLYTSNDRYGMFVSF